MERKKQFWLICIFLALITLSIFLPVVHFDFTNYDDPDYVTENAHVKRGLTLEGAAWALQSGHAANWHPVTWLSHMLDWQLFGKWPGGHHLTNVILHTLNALLLFSFLTMATGAMWRSAMVVALFALHPMHVESVAWISERKDVLSTFFLLLTLRAYFHYTQRRSTEGPNLEPVSKQRDYLFALLFFALGLMSKPMLVTLPFVLLLLDFWPLRRMEFSTSPLKTIYKLTAEKFPFFAMAIVSSAITFFVQKEGGAVSSLTHTAFPVRFFNMLVSYCRYIGKMFWPVDLSVFYPQESWSVWWIVAAGCILILITVLAAWFASSRPYLLVGWFLFLGMLVPVIGLVQVGSQSMADRYSYVPYVGLFIMLVWGLHELLARRSKKIFSILALLSITACALIASRQLHYWPNSVSLFEHAFAVTKESYTVRSNLGQALAASHQMEKAKPHFLAALRLRPFVAEAHNNVGRVLAEEKKTTEAMAFYRRALELKPDYAVARLNMAKLLDSEGRLDEAIENYLEVLRLKPDGLEARFYLGRAFAKKQKWPEATAHYRAALKIEPDDPETHYNLANALLRSGNAAEAILHYQYALKLNPNDFEAYNNLASALEKTGAVSEAAAHFQEAIRLKPNFADAHFNFALLLLKQRKFSEATAHFNRVVQLQKNNEQAHFQLGILNSAQKKPALAITHLREVLRIKPDWPGALNFLARIVATHPDAKIRDADESIKLAEQACALTQNKNSFYLDTLAAAYAEKKQFADAVRIAEQARSLAAAGGQEVLLKQIEGHLQLFKAGEPLRE